MTTYRACWPVITRSLPSLPNIEAQQVHSSLLTRPSEQAMAAASHNAIPSLLLLLLLLLASTAAWSASADIFFQGFQGANNLTLDGVARVTPEGVLQLTNFTTKAVGHAFYSSPVRMLDVDHSAAGKKPAALSFSTTFVFEIADNGTKGAQGLAFVFAPSTTIGGPNSGQYLGLLTEDTDGNSSNHLFAIEFDTFQNWGIVDGYTDIPENHVGVDINSLASNFTAAAAYYENDMSNQSLNLEGGKPIQAWIDYSAETKVLNITIAPTLTTPKPPKPLISQVVDLPFVLKEYMYVGFSSSTAKYLASSHYITGWSFSTNGTARPLDVSRLPEPRPLSTASKTNLLEDGAIVVASTLAFVVLVASVVWYLWRRAKLGDNIEDWELECPHRFSYKDLYRATKGFDDGEILGAGGFGKVYKGVLPRTREEVAIKKISSNSKQGLQEFVSEIASLGRMRHRHLVQLHGWCKKNADLLLVYEFMPNGSLDRFLFSQDKGVLLSWDDRFKILKGVAQGLLYLHEEFEQVVVHRDVKSGNVLLDADMNGKLGDFGLAKLYEHGQNPETTRLVGTLGYIAPELTYAGKATECSDVYAYGMLLLEIACGRKAIEPSAPPGELVLVNRVRAHWGKGQLLDVADPRLQGCYVREEVERVLALGLHCCQSVPELRPTMRQVTQYLNGDDKLRDDASLVFSDVTSFDLASGISHSNTSYSYGNMSLSVSFPR